MKTLKDLKIEPIQELEPEVRNEEQPIIPDQAVITDYMLTNPNLVGYETPEQQESIYRMAAHGFNIASMADFGCGRGDFGSYVSKVINPNVKYIGIDTNKLMIDIGATKYSSTLPNLEFKQFNCFDLSAEEPEADIMSEWVFNVLNLSIPYGNTSLGPKEQLDKLIDISLAHCTVGTVFILINTRSKFDGYYQYPQGGLIQVLESKNLRFSIDNSEIMDIYKLVIFKQTY